MGVETRKKKQSTKTRKDWKKLDVQAEEEIQHEILKVKAEEATMSAMKDSQMFVIDTGDQALKKAKRSRVEERLIKNLKRNVAPQKEEEVYKMQDIWATTESSKPRTISYPSVPKPHPGQSYNPSNTDFSQLLKKVEKVFERPQLPVEEPMPLKSTAFEESDSEEIVGIPTNKPVKSEDRLKKVERNRKRKAKLNRQINEELRAKKQVRKELSTIISAKKYEARLIKKIHLNEREEKKL